MQCDACGEANPASHRFCQGCGARLPQPCPGCGAPTRAGARFCGACGTSLAPPRADTPRAAFRRVQVMEGEIKPVTVLVSDLVRSTELVADLGPEAAMGRLQPVLEQMCAAVERSGGTVIAGLGDGIVALFGAPRAQEGHALRACHAALAIRDAVCGLGQDLAVRTGLHSGDVVADMPTDGLERDLNAYGMTLHLASRLPAEAEPGGICLTEACRALLPDAYALAPMGPRRLRGVPAPVVLHALLGPRPGGAARPPAEAAAPMVGRDREMARLRQALVATEPGEARIAAVIGAPGTGKSRLCQEFAAACRAEGLPVAAIRVQPYGTARPLQPMTEFLRSAWLGLEAEEAGPLSAARVEQALAAAGAADPVDAAVVCDFLGIPGRMALPAWLNPVARIARLVDIVTTLVRRRGAERSVILLEDLHWLDEASEGFVAALAAAVRDTRCLLVVNSRPGHDRPWMQPPRANRIALAELGEAETGALIASLVGPDPALAGLRARIAARSGGNPFFAEELVRALRGQGIIAGESGAFRRGEAEGQGVLPPNLQAVIGARIDSLAGTPRRVLQTAAVIGQTFRLPVLQAVAQLDRAALDVALAGLCEDGLLQRAPGMAEPDFQFRHPLIREVAYGMQLQARRAPLHAAVARAMERLDPARQEDAAALIAYHHEEGGEPRQAAVYAAHAARWLGPRSSAEATRFWHKVRGLLAGMPRAPESDRLRIEASGQIAWVGWREGLTPEQARPFVEEALGWAGETDDSVQPLLMLVAARITQVNGGSADTFVAEIRRAIALAAARGDAGRVATLQAALSHAYGWAGLLRQALEASDAALAGVGAVSDFDHRFLGYSLRHWALALRGRILVRLGRFEEGTACLDAIIAINELIDPTVQFIGHVGYVDLAWCTDDAAMAARHAAKIAALAARHGSSYLRAYSAAIEAIARGIAGNHDAAAEGIERSLGLLAESRAAIEFEPELLASLAEHRLRLADAAGAAAAARRAIGLAASRASRLPACRARITLAQALPASTEAATLLAEAEALIEETGATIFRPRWRLARRALDGRVSREGPGR